MLHKVEAYRYRAATLVGGATELKSIRLLDITSFVSSAQNMIIKDVSLIYDLNAKYAFFEEENKLTVQIEFGLKSPDAKRIDAGNQGISVQAVYELTYKFKIEPPPPELREIFFESFASIGAVYVLWPFWRELVSSLTQRLGVDPIILPVIQFKPDEKTAETPQRPNKKRAAKNKQAEPRVIAKRRRKDQD